MQKNFKSIEATLKRYTRVYNKYQEELSKLDQNNDYSSDYKLREKNRLTRALMNVGEKAYEGIQADIEGLREAINAQNNNMDFLNNNEFSNALKIIELSKNKLSIEAIESLTNKFADSHQALTMLKAIYRDNNMYAEGIDGMISKLEHGVDGLDDAMYYALRSDNPKIYNLVDSVSILAEKQGCQFDSNIEAYGAPAPDEGLTDPGYQGASSAKVTLSFDQLVENF